MRFLRSALAAAALILAALAGSPALAKEVINTNGSDHNVAISGLDTVAFFTQHKPVQGDEAIFYEWKGARWLFASAQDRDLFKADPEKYAPQWGGYCAVGVSEGHLSKHLVKGSFDIHDGKLYLFAEGKPDDFDYWRKHWLETEGGPISRIPVGESYWAQLKPLAEAGAQWPDLKKPKQTAQTSTPEAAAAR
jgi:YHS domain-containing protein